MSEQPLRLIILARDQSTRIQQAWSELEELLRAESGCEIVASAVIDDFEFEDLQADLVVTLGGDGAILRVCRQMGMQQMPILGINLGRLGFLADLTPQEFRDNFETICSRRYLTVEHLMFTCRLIHADGQSESHIGLNEVVISSAASLRMLDITLSIDGEPVTTYSGDGLIISTAVGSTAHSLSAGGPILKQDMAAFVITPICPHTLTNRPVVDRADCVYTLTVPDAPAGAMIVIDGQVQRELQPSDVLEVRRADVSCLLAKLPGFSYYATLNRKLGWGGQPRYRTT